MPMDGGDAVQLTKGKGSINQFAWSPDGLSIAYAMSDPKPQLTGEDKYRTTFRVGNDDITVSEAVRPVHLWMISAQGGDSKRLTSGSWSLPSSLPPGPPSSPIAWSKDGKSIVFVRQETPSTGDQFLTRIQVLEVATGSIRSLTGDSTLEGFPIVSPDGSTVAYWRNRDAQPWAYQDVWIAPFEGGKGRDISALLDKNVFVTRWAPNGAWRLVGGNVDATVGLWRLKVDGAATHGWVVFEPNYRGSDNLGNAFYASIYKDAGQGPGEDVMSGVEFLKSRGLIDPARMAVTGWSYGGFMSTWLAGHYPLWKAAVAGAPLTDWVEMYDLSDGNVTAAASTGASPYLGDGMAINRRQSPSNSVTKIRAPTLILCDTGDFRVPIAQSFGLYRALKDNHVATEFYAIPTAGHFPPDPILQMDVYQRWIDWLVKYLK